MSRQAPIIIILLIVLAIGLQPASLHSQHTVAVDIEQDSVLLGEPIEMVVTIKVPTGTDITSIYLNGIDSSRNLAYQADNPLLDEHLDWEILSAERWMISGDDRSVEPQSYMQARARINSQDIYSERLTVAFYSMGYFAVEPPTVVSSDSISWMRLQPPVVLVSPPESIMQRDSLSLQPIKPIIKEALWWSDFIHYLYAVLVLVLVAGIVWWLTRLRRGDIVDQVVVPPPPPPPAHQVALSALEDLRAEQLWQAGEIKAYQSRLTDIIRQYLEDRYDIHAMESTTQETLRALEATAFDKQYEQRLAEILQVADMIKFAQARPDVSIHDQYMDTAVTFVQDTRETPSEVEHE